MKLLFLYGPPASGKFAVAKETARLIDFKLFNNHFAFDLCESIFDAQTETFKQLVEDIRVHVVEQAAKHHIQGVIFTFVYRKGQDEPFIERVVVRWKGIRVRLCLYRYLARSLNFKEEFAMSQGGLFTKCLA